MWLRFMAILNHMFKEKSIKADGAIVSGTCWGSYFSYWYCCVPAYFLFPMLHSSWLPLDIHHTSQYPPFPFAIQYINSPFVGRFVLKEVVGLCYCLGIAYACNLAELLHVEDLSKCDMMYPWYQQPYFQVICMAPMSGSADTDGCGFGRNFCSSAGCGWRKIGTFGGSHASRILWVSL